MMTEKELAFAERFFAVPSDPAIKIRVPAEHLWISQLCAEVRAYQSLLRLSICPACFRRPLEDTSCGHHWHGSARAQLDANAELKRLTP